MVIDALRYDFMSEKYMPYTAGLIKNGKACLYKAKAEPPTVTMPRIKVLLNITIDVFCIYVVRKVYFLFFFFIYMWLTLF